MNRVPLIVAGIVFSIVALMQLLRVIYQWEVVIGGYSIPILASIIAFIFATVLAIWMFKTASK